VGEARAKLDADAVGIARPRDEVCPACKSKRLHLMPKERFPGIEVDVDWQGCLDCGEVWEPFPASYVRDPVCAEPCDNCAFRPGSPEQRDTERWKQLMASLKPNSEGWFNGRFYCHKGVPIDLEVGPGNFKFPTQPVLLDGKPLLNQDGSVVTTWDVKRMRTCSGFLRMVWALNDKRSGATS
jgi:hypothetical protein